MKLKIAIGIVFLLLMVIVACQSDEQLEFTHYYSSGAVVYKNLCQNCHGQHGEGLNGLIPPLTDSLYLKNNKPLLACAVKYGLKGKIAISNKTFEGSMPPNDLPSIEIAEALTYITNSFGNKIGTITAQQVDNYLKDCIHATGGY